MLGPLDLWEDVEEDVNLDWRTAGDVIWERTTTITTISYDITCTCNLAMLMLKTSNVVSAPSRSAPHTSQGTHTFVAQPRAPERPSS